MPTLHYIYSAHSAFAYLGSKALYEICARHGVTLIHKPVLLSPVVEAQGSLPFRARTQAHVDYFFGREIERWAEWRGMPVLKQRPTFHDADYSLASGMILALGDRGAEVDAMAHALLEAHWVEDADLSNPMHLAKVAAKLGQEPQSLLARAASSQVQAQLTANTGEAQQFGIMGSPTYIVDGDAFYGQDRLEMVERALTQPFAPSTWVNPSVTPA